MRERKTNTPVQEGSQIQNQTSDLKPIKMILIIKMLYHTIIITLMIVTGDTVECAKNRTHRSSTIQTQDIIDDDIQLTEISADVDEAVFDLKCPIEEMIVRRDDLSSNITDSYLKEQVELIKRRIARVDWLRDGEVWTGGRENGNNVDPTRDNLGYHLYQLGESDSGFFVCRADFTGLPRNFTKLFRFYRGASFQLQVIRGLPNLSPTITHPPGNLVVKPNQSAVFTCSRTETLSHQTTYWFRSCPYTNTSCVDRFLQTFKRSEQDKNMLLMMPYVIDNQNQDTLMVANVTDNSVGYYACAVRNALGTDIRLGKLELFESWLDANQRAVIANQVQAIRTQQYEWVWFVMGISAFIFLSVLISGSLYCIRLSMSRDKKQQQQQQQQNDPLIIPDISGGCRTSLKESNLRQHLPTLGCPNIYNISKSADGFISGHLHQNTGHILAQSICSNILDKDNPSISSSNSQNSDEASLTWGKSLCSQTDHCRNFYLHTSNTTATTMPMYDHPPSNGTTMRRCNAMVQNSCVINPTYGFLKPEDDTSEWNFPRRNLEALKQIGEGQFGEVWLFIAKPKCGKEKIVAVKKLKQRIGLGDRDRLELIAEIEIMKSLNRHPNVIKLLNYCIDEYEPTLLIMEYAELGKLQTYLRNCRATSRQFCCESDRTATVTSKELLKFTYHIARGMEYVASQGIVHRDLASRNILVSKEKVCKVADFGFARRLNDDCAYERTTETPVPVKWMAPEALVENKFTTKSDIFSFGVLMWEIVTLGATPYEQMSSDGVYKMVTAGGRLERPTHCCDEFYDLMSQCWSQDPALRPTFKEVAAELEKLILSDNDYIKLDQYPEHAYYNITNTAEKEVVNLETQSK